MKYKMRFFAFFAAMVVFNLAANFAHPVTPTVIQELHLHGLYVWRGAGSHADHELPAVAVLGKDQ